MLRRARNWLVLAVIAAVFGFAGVLRSTAVLAQGLFYISSSFAVLSVLFSFFEEESASKRASQVQTQPSVIPLHVVEALDTTPHAQIPAALQAHSAQHASPTTALAA